MDRRGLLMAGGAYMASGTAPKEKRTITVLRGEVDDANLERVSSMIADANDNVIGLKLRFNPPRNDSWSVEVQDECGGDIFDGEIELNVSGGTYWVHGWSTPCPVRTSWLPTDAFASCSDARPDLNADLRPQRRRHHRVGLHGRIGIGPVRPRLSGEFIAAAAVAGFAAAIA